MIRYKRIFTEDEDYRGRHTAPTNDGFCRPLYDVTGMYPDDIYTPAGVRYYGDGISIADKESWSKIQEYRGRPDAIVTIYRAVPKGVKNANIVRGDWVTLSKAYAKGHGISVLDGNYTILTKKVKAKDLWTEGNSMNEWGYDPS
jgi:hypothetical protein